MNEMILRILNVTTYSKRDFQESSSNWLDFSTQEWGLLFSVVYGRKFLFSLDSRSRPKSDVRQRGLLFPPSCEGERDVIECA